MKNIINTSITITFGTKIRELRKSRGLSQESLADLAELDRSYIGGVERGDRNISLINIQKLSIALNVNIAEFFKELND
ncbi:XRE family transcriptional regulator (plasmid) [Shewanella morhuae]|uniref:XRE family transcriptional regulator n=1 Tax=Shewanella morhuae TaxID=365591 RepID=A0ABX5HZ31_9GAMM|nr:helix-turn-helix transcriptional regulator [Shewanella morhuae]PTA51826.1 XRE family transcriptional regulator [Shewanella morhuae]